MRTQPASRNNVGLGGRKEKNYSGGLKRHQRSGKREVLSQSKKVKGTSGRTSLREALVPETVNVNLEGFKAAEGLCD